MYLGEEMQQEADFSIKRSMATYFEKVEPLPLKRSEGAAKPLSDDQITPLRSLVMKMAWPARKLMSQIAYGVSTAAQGITTATVGLARRANKLLQVAKSEAAAGRAELTYRKVDLSRPCVVTFFDESLGQEEDG